MAILGTVFGIFWGLIAMAVGSASNSVDDDGSGTGVIWLGVSAILACSVAMTFSSFHFSGKKQGWMAGGIVVCSLWHLFSISYFGIPGFIFLVLAGIFAAFGKDAVAPPKAAETAAAIF